MMQINEFCQITPVLDIEKVKDRRDLPEIRCKEEAVLFLGKKVVCNAFEECICIFLDASCRVISYAVVGRGTPWSTPQDITTIISCCLLLNASQVIIMHNHPLCGYDPIEPSAQDIKMTIHLKNLLEKYFRINLLDSLVVCDMEETVVMKSILHDLNEEQLKVKTTQAEKEIFL